MNDNNKYPQFNQQPIVGWGNQQGNQQPYPYQPVQQQENLPFALNQPPQPPNLQAQPPSHSPMNAQYNPLLQQRPPLNQPLPALAPQAQQPQPPILQIYQQQQSIPIQATQAQFGAWDNAAKQEKKRGTIAIVQDMAKQGVDKVLRNEVFIEVQRKAETVKEGIQKDFRNLDNKLQDVLRQQKEKMNIWVRLKIEEILMKILEQLRPNLKEAIKDPYMCACVKNLIDDIFDEVWPDIQEEVLLQLRLKYAVPYDEKVNVKPKMCCLELPWYYIKKWYLYTVDPFDRSIWQQFRTFSWWFFFIIALIPFYGVQSFFYTFVFLCIDKKDEFQLVNYILRFKKMQFITLGGIGTIVGYLTFYSCSTASQLDDPKKYDECRTEGPAIFLNFWTDIIGFLLQLALVLLAFCLLPCSKVKGKVKFKYAKEKEPQERKQDCCCCLCNLDRYTLEEFFNIYRGGRLKGFMVYDIICFLLCVGLFLLLSISEGTKQLWQYKATMFLVKTLYGLLSLPFLIFGIPSMTWLLTKSKDTGYDKYGNCVPQVENLKQYHVDRMLRSSILGKPQPGTYDERYTKLPDRKITIIEEEPLMEELVDQEAQERRK